MAGWGREAYREGQWVECRGCILENGGWKLETDVGILLYQIKQQALSMPSSIPASLHESQNGQSLDVILFFQHKLGSDKSSCNNLSSRHHPNPRQPAASLTSPFPCSPTTPIPLHKITHYSSITAPTSLDR